MDTTTARKLIFWATVASGAIAAVLLYRRGTAPSKIASKVLTHPVGTLFQELYTPAPQPREA